MEGIVYAELIILAIVIVLIVSHYGVASTSLLSSWHEVRSAGGMELTWLSGIPFNFFSRGAGILLARAHARTGDAAVIAGYCGGSSVLDKALADWAEVYGEQTVNDHAALLKAIESGRIIAQ